MISLFSLPNTSHQNLNPFPHLINHYLLQNSIPFLHLLSHHPSMKRSLVSQNLQPLNSYQIGSLHIVSIFTIFKYPLINKSPQLLVVWKVPLVLGGRPIQMMILLLPTPSHLINLVPPFVQSSLTNKITYKLATVSTNYINLDGPFQNITQSFARLYFASVHNSLRKRS